jgi:hypothetical protein
MEWGIALVLAQCAVGFEALTAGAEHGLLVHDSLVSSDEVESVSHLQITGLAAFEQ